MSQLIGHARAARIIGDALIDRAARIPEFGAGLILEQMGEAFRDASDRMEAAMRADSQAHAAATACTFDHRTMKGPKCLACGAPRA